MINMKNRNLSKFKIWLLAIRPKTLPAAIAPVIAGTSVAIWTGSYIFLPAFAALMGALLLQIGSNLANDLFDYLRGVDREERLGTLRVTQAGLLSIHEMRIGMYLVFGLAICVGVYLTILGGLPIIIIGITAIMAAIAYTTGPYPLGYHGLGDIFVFIFFGLVATMGTYYVQARSVNLLSFLVSISIGLLIVNILVVNNYRDYIGDKGSGKRTFAVIIGKKWSRRQYGLNNLIAYLIIFLLVIIKLIPVTTLLTWVTIPLAIHWMKTLKNKSGKALNITLAGTSQLSTIFASLLFVGIIVGKFF